MGEAKRRRTAALFSEHFPGGRGRCPVCLSTHVIAAPTPDGLREFYGRELVVCLCGAAWEPVDEAGIWNREDEMCSTKEPCDNCAFRPASPEQADKEKWNSMIEKLKTGQSFYCHKGVPIDPGGEDGFKYQKHNRNKLRLCRGYLNALGKWWRAPADTGSTS